MCNNVSKPTGGPGLLGSSIITGGKGERASVAQLITMRLRALTSGIWQETRQEWRWQACGDILLASQARVCHQRIAKNQCLQALSSFRSFRPRVCDLGTAETQQSGHVRNR